MKGSGAATDPREIDRFDGGVGWIAYPDEGMQRASHALAGEDGVWVVDPVDAEGIDDLYAEFGDVTGVVVALDRHQRDAAAVARRHDVPVYVPTWMRDSVSFEGVAVETFDSALPDDSYRAIPVIKNPFWKEVALHDPDAGTLLVAEAVGTGDYFRVGSERLGVHPMLRPFPPRKQFRDLSPERVLVGHGDGVMEDGASALRRGLRGARKRMPGAYAKAARSMLPF